MGDGLFSWDDVPSAGACEDTLQSTEKGKALLGLDRDTSCEKKVVPKDCNVPAIIVDHGEGPEYHDGSASQPIRLTNLQEQSAGSFVSIAFKRADGTIVAWKPATGDNCQYRLIAKNGNISLVIDDTVNEFDDVQFDASQDPASDNVEFLMGGKVITGCDGKPKVKLLKVDKTKLCEWCDTISVV